MQADFTCDMNCPFEVDEGVWCCKGCHTERKYWVKNTNKKFWTKKNGFRGKSGCKLKREDMPPDCRSYDCKTYGWDVWHIQYAVIGWDGEKWARRGQVSIEDGVGNMTTSVFADKFTTQKRNY